MNFEKATLVYICITVCTIVITEVYRRQCVATVGQADSVQYYGLFIVHQVYIQKPWFMLLCMLVIDIDFVRTFIIQVFLTRNELNDPRLRSGFSFLSQVKGKFKEDFF